MVTYCPKCHYEMELCFSGSSLIARCRNGGCEESFRVTELLIKNLADGDDYMIKVDDS